MMLRSSGNGHVSPKEGGLWLLRPECCGSVLTVMSGQKTRSSVFDDLHTGMRAGANLSMGGLSEAAIEATPTAQLRRALESGAKLQSISQHGPRTGCVEYTLSGKP